MALTADQEGQLVSEIDRAHQARLILESPIFAQAIEMIEADTLEKWKSSPVRDTEGQLALRLKWQIIQEFKTQFSDAVQTGKLASQQLEHERTLAERARDMMSNAVRALRR